MRSVEISLHPIPWVHARRNRDCVPCMDGLTFRCGRCFEMDYEACTSRSVPLGTPQNASPALPTPQSEQSPGAQNREVDRDVRSRVDASTTRHVRRERTPFLGTVN